MYPFELESIYLYDGLKQFSCRNCGSRYNYKLNWFHIYSRMGNLLLHVDDWYGADPRRKAEINLYIQKHSEIFSVYRIGIDPCPYCKGILQKSDYRRIVHGTLFYLEFNRVLERLPPSTPAAVERTDSTYPFEFESPYYYERVMELSCRSCGSKYHYLPDTKLLYSRMGNSFVRLDNDYEQDPRGKAEIELYTRNHSELFFLYDMNRNRFCPYCKGAIDESDQRLVDRGYILSLSAVKRPLPPVGAI